LQLLERIAFDACPQRLLHDRHQIDQHLIAQQVIELVLTAGEAPHHGAERRLLEGGKVINVKIAVPPAPLDHDIHEALEVLLLLATRRCPPALILQRSRWPAQRPTEQIVKRPIRRVAVGLDVEEHVTGAGSRKPAKPSVVLHWKHLETWSGSARLELEPGL